MNQNLLAKLSKVSITILSIMFTTSLFSPAFGQPSENSSDNIEVVEQAVLQDFSQRTGVEIPNPDIAITTDYKEWSNTCLELKKSDEECIDVTTPGWEVIIDKAEESYVYHTNENGSIVKFKNSFNSLK